MICPCCRQSVPHPLKLRRELRGLSQEQLAAAANVGQPAISNYERGRKPTLDVALRIAGALLSTVEQIWGRDAPATTLEIK